MSVSHAAPPDNQFNPKVGCPQWCDHAGECRWRMDNGEVGHDYRLHEHVLSDAVRVEQWEHDDNEIGQANPVVIDYYREHRDDGLTAAQATVDGISLLLAASVLGVQPTLITSVIAEIPGVVEWLMALHADASVAADEDAA